MALSELLGPNTPDWLLGISLIGSFVLITGLAVWGLVLERKYKNPYTLASASAKEKWRWAIQLAILQTALAPIIGLVQPIISPLPDQWPGFPIFCFGIWIIVLPVMTFYKRMEFNRTVKMYQKLDKMLKQNRSFSDGFFSSPFVSWVKKIWTSEQTKFFSDGYEESQNATNDDQSE